MTQLLLQSTAAAISFGPFVAQDDGNTLKTGLVSAIDHASTGIKLSKNGGALTIRHASVTASSYDGYGNYIVTLDTTDTNTLGRLRMQFADATTNLPVWQDFMVVPANTYNSLVLATAVLSANPWDLLRASYATLGSFGQGMQGVVRQNTCQTDGSPDSTHAVLDSSASATDDAYNDMWLAIVAGTGLGQQPRAIVDYIGSTKRALLDPPLTVNVDNTTEYAIFS